MKRWISLLMTIVLMFGVCVSGTGCGKEESLHILTREEWIAQLADSFGLTQCYDGTPVYEDVDADNKYFNEIQACAEWEVIDKTKKFEPKKKADVNFAIETAVRMIGVDRIAKSIDGEILENSEDYIDYFNKNSDVKYISGQSLYADTANTLLEDTQKIYGNMELKQVEEIDMTDNVKSCNSEEVWFSADGKTGKILNGQQYSDGDIIVIEACTEYPEGKCVKITGIVEDTFSYVKPEIEEVYNSVVISGTYDAQILGIIPIDDSVEIESSDGTELTKVSCMTSDLTSGIIYVADDNKDKNDDGIDMKIKGGNNSAIDSAELKISYDGLVGTIKISDIQPTVDIEMKGPIVKRIDMSLKDKVKMSAELETKNKKKIQKKIPVGKIPCTIAPGLTVNIVVSLEVALTGKVNVTLSLDGVEGVSYKPFCTPRNITTFSNPSASVAVEANAKVKPQVKAEFAITEFKIGNIGVYTGLDVTAKVEQHDNKLTCVDATGYVPLAIFIGAEERETLLGKLGISYTYELWKKDNSKFKCNLHIENGEKVEKCTWNKEQEQATEEKNDIQESDEEREQAQAELKRIEKEMLNGECIDISSYYVVLDEGCIDNLLVVKLPEGYTQEDITYETSDSSVATVNQSGQITAIGEGNTVIKVRTNDQEYIQCCAVYVNAVYDVDFTPLINRKEEVKYATFL